jgi:hypothetical protein
MKCEAFKLDPKSFVFFVVVAKDGGLWYIKVGTLLVSKQSDN